MNRRRRWVVIAVLLIAFLVGYAVSEIWVRLNPATQEYLDSMYGLVRHESGMTVLQNPMTLNSVTEYSYDVDGDAQVDRRGVVIANGLERQGFYSSSHVGDSIEPTSLLISLGVDRSFNIQIKDTENDGVMDRLLLGFTEYDEGDTVYFYVDFNLDGLLDTMTIRNDGETERRHILLEYEWVPSTEKSENGIVTVWIEEIPGKLQRVEFDGTEWVRIVGSETD